MHNYFAMIYTPSCQLTTSTVSQETRTTALITRWIDQEQYTEVEGHGHTPPIDKRSHRMTVDTFPTDRA